MKIRYFFLILLLAAFGGCSGPGSPDSEGTEKTNVMLSATVSPQHLDDIKTDDVDIYQTGDCDGEADTIDPEPFTKHSATIDITGKKVAPALPSGILYIERYTIEYFTVTPGAPPVEAFLDGFQSVTIYVDQSTGDVAPTSFNVDFFDFDRKRKYSGDATSGQYDVSIFGDYPTYIARYTFHGEDQYGHDFSFKADREFKVGDFYNCE